MVPIFRGYFYALFPIPGDLGMIMGLVAANVGLKLGSKGLKVVVFSEASSAHFMILA
jgi:hypothetical protein